MKGFFAKLSPYMNNFPEMEWLHQFYSRLDWRIVQQFTNSANSHLNKNWPSEFPLEIDGPHTKDFAGSSPFLSWDQQTNLFGRIGAEILWPERQDVINPVVASVEYGILAMMALFFLFSFGVCAWQLHRYAGFVQKALLHQEITWFFALQTFFAFAPFFIASLAAGIYGLKGIFFVFSLIGFALTVVFIVDLAAKNESESSKAPSDRK